MIWSSASEFWSMGGYGVFVWGSMGVSAALLAAEVWLTRLGRRYALDAVCEAMDAEMLNAEPVCDPLASPAKASHPSPLPQGAVT